MNGCGEKNPIHPDLPPLLRPIVPLLEKCVMFQLLLPPISLTAGQQSLFYQKQICDRSYTVWLWFTWGNEMFLFFPSIVFVIINCIWLCSMILKNGTLVTLSLLQIIMLCTKFY